MKNKGKKSNFYILNNHIGMNLFLFVFSISILLVLFFIVKKYGITEKFIADFSIDDLENITYDIKKNKLIVSKRFDDFWDCNFGRGPHPIKSNFV